MAEMRRQEDRPEVVDLASLTGGRLLARNTVLNLIGQASPMVVAFVTIPLIIDRIGTERFGALTLIWMVIGYFSLFDLGLSRALTQAISERLAGGSDDEIPSLVGTGLLIMAILGAAGSVLLWILTPTLVGDVLKVPQSLLREATISSLLLALSLPVVISTAGLRGILESLQRFDLVNAIRIPMGVFTFLAPLLVLPFSTSLIPITVVSLIGRTTAWAVHLILCLRVDPRVRPGGFDRAMLAPLFKVGGWMTVSNIISPIMVYLDRFLIGSVVSLTAVTFYVTPYELITKLWLIPGALVGVLFPAFAASMSTDRQRSGVLYRGGLDVAFLLLFPLTLAVVAFAPEGLSFWLGEDFARHSTTVLRLLAGGVFINSLAHISFAVVQGAGRSDLTAKLHLLVASSNVPEFRMYTCAARKFDGAGRLSPLREQESGCHRFLLRRYEQRPRSDNERDQQRREQRRADTERLRQGDDYECGCSGR